MKILFDVKIGAGSKVELIPATPYTKERFLIVAEKNFYAPMEPPDPRLNKYVRTTIADPQGTFEFQNIPPGEYILSCVIRWHYGRTMHGSAEPIVFTSVAGDEVKRVVLTK